MQNEVSKDVFHVVCVKSVQNQILLQEDKPFRERARRIPLRDLEDLWEQLAELRIFWSFRSHSRSLYASPIVVVQKKNGSLHMCTDFRTMNRHTVLDQYMTPRIENALRCLTGSKWFSVFLEDFRGA